MMDISSSLQSLQASLAMVSLQKAMGKDAQSMAILLSDMKAAVPAPAQTLAPKAGALDVRV